MKISKEKLIEIESLCQRIDFMITHNADNNFWKDKYNTGFYLLGCLDRTITTKKDVNYSLTIENELELIETALFEIDNDELWLDDEDAYTYSDFMDRLRDVWDIINPEKGRNK